jgi:tRNA(Ile)-lysidine synthase
MRLLRASDVDGLSAPRAVTIFPGGFMKLRPLLEFSREKIINILRANGVEWRSDGSNLENNFLRNRIRNCVLPKLREAAAFTDAIGRLADAKINMEEAADAIAFCADECIARRNISGGMLAGDLRHLPAAICRKIVAKFLDANGVGVRKSRVAPLVDGIRRGKSVTLSAGGERFIHWDGEYLKISERKVPLRWHVENLKIGTHTLPTGDALRIEEVEPGSPLLRNLRTVDTAKMCCAAIPAGANISAENYAANRRYVRFGHRRARKLGDILPAKIYGGSGRDRLPVVFANGEICWVPGLPVADIFCIKDGCESALLLTYLRRAFS